ncbi:MAG: sigma-70 family RNA polymerase sigma factor [Thermaerobacter sp.]|nr:sigma-70 family RNA polymerase sigma factor [Thermaerobacter sp.]
MRRHAARIPPDLLDRLYAGEYDRLVRYAERLCGDEAQAEDVVQEAFMRLMAAPPPDWGRLPAWMRTVVRRLCFDVGRRLARTESLVARLEAPGAGEPAAISAEEAALARWDGTRVVAALNALPAQQARALWLRHSGHRYQEIARMTGIPEDQVGVVLLRAMKKLRTEYGKGGDWAHGTELPGGNELASAVGPRDHG